MAPSGGVVVNVVLAALLALVLTTPAAPQDGAVPVEDEPFHKTVFKNAYIQAFRVILAPGTVSRMHTHSHDDAAIRLSSATATDESADGTVGAPASFEPGLVTARQNEPKAITHRVHNVGATVFDVMDVQILSRPPGPAAAAVAPPAAENPQMRMYRYELPPGESTPRHSHTRPFLLVAATNADLDVTATAGSTEHLSMKPGDLQWVESTVTHAFVNRGKERAILVEFELK
jgi:quercetin dioxygenase-like cupin family protein